MNNHLPDGEDTKKRNQYASRPYNILRLGDNPSGHSRGGRCSSMIGLPGPLPVYLWVQDRTQHWYIRWLVLRQVKRVVRSSLYMFVCLLV